MLLILNELKFKLIKDVVNKKNPILLLIFFIFNPVAKIEFHSCFVNLPQINFMLNPEK